MARLARVVAPGFPHHVTQRGNRRLPTFLRTADYELYIALMAEWCGKCGVEVWAYCLMPNHVHLIVAPSTEEGLARAIGQAHWRYSRHVNFREGWRGFLWQGRFASFTMDESHLLAAARYVELNPIRAGLAKDPWSYRWSSAKAHARRRDDVLVKVKPLLELAGDWKEFLASGLSGGEAEVIRRHERTGRPLGENRFLDRIEKLVGRVVRKRKPGPKPDGGMRRDAPRTRRIQPIARRCAR